MARVRDAFLANYASQETSGLISAIGAFVDTVYAPTLPARHVFYLVASIAPEPDEIDRDLDIAIRLTRAADAEVVLEARGQMRAERDPTGNPEASPTGRVVVPIPAAFEREGKHVLSISIGSEVVWDTPIFAVLVRGPAG